MNLLSIDMNELESKKQVICKEKEETEQKRALILSSVSDNLKLDDSTVQEEAFLTVKIARMQACHNLIDFILSVMVTKKHVHSQVFLFRCLFNTSSQRYWQWLYSRNCCLYKNI
jgi:hypothetical protein